jgi:hypothetical protein
MEEVRPDTGREAGLGRAGDRAPKAGASGDAWSNCRKDTEKFLNENTMTLLSLRLCGEFISL